MKVYQSLLDLIGHTPILEVHGFDLGGSHLFLKLEHMNPGGSIKDRIGVGLIAAAEARGAIRPPGLLVEATAGNTGIALALAALRKGYSLLLIVPDKMSSEKIAQLRAMGAEIRITRSDVPRGHPEHYQDLAERIAHERGGYYVNQFANPDNPRVHERETGPEIWEQMGGELDVIVLGAGTTGTLTGVGRYLKRQNPKIEVVLADPLGSVLAGYLKTGQLTEKGRWLVEGIGEDHIPPICDLRLVDRAYTIPDHESFAAIRQLLKNTGLLAGTSTGTLLAAALRYAREASAPKRILTLACDTGTRYLSKAFNPDWLYEQGLTPRRNYGDLRDCVSHHYAQGEVASAAPTDSLEIAYRRMRQGEYSQLPVLDGGRLVGLLTEVDLMMALADPARGALCPVRDSLGRAAPELDSQAPLESLIRLLTAEPAVAIRHAQAFYGLATRTDVITHFRRAAETAGSPT
ncbi:cystathionine beta-synthase [mine drainage metagenome]|uniref:Cystathionine beta-synthase n=2 Tax=mine drainage metagenome TaxID=410659 RepID=T1CZH3_9ZZZZ